jgi:hypothetical protein
MIDVHVVIPPDLVHKLTVAQYDKALEATVRGVAEALHERIAKYPGPSHRPVIWQSAGERVAYYAMRRKAGLPLKYTRQSDPMSQRLGPGWTAKRTGALEYTVGNKATYAAKVQAEAYQHPQHKATGWKTDTQAIAELRASGDIERIGRQQAAFYLGATHE